MATVPDKQRRSTEMVGRLPRLTRRPFADLAVWMAAFGLAVGLVFPAFSVSLGVPPAVAFRPLFQLGCLGAGLLVGLCNFALARSVVGTRLRRLAAGMSAVRASLATAMDSGEGRRLWPARVQAADRLRRRARNGGRGVQCPHRRGGPGADGRAGPHRGQHRGGPSGRGRPAGRGRARPDPCRHRRPRRRRTPGPSRCLHHARPAPLASGPNRGRARSSGHYLRGHPRSMRSRQHPGR